jgi:hypothetical protein
MKLCKQQQPLGSACRNISAPAEIEPRFSFPLPCVTEVIFGYLSFSLINSDYTQAVWKVLQFVCETVTTPSTEYFFSTKEREGYYCINEAGIP